MTEGTSLRGRSWARKGASLFGQVLETREIANAMGRRRLRTEHGIERTVARTWGHASPGGIWAARSRVIRWYSTLEVANEAERSLSRRSPRKARKTKCSVVFGVRPRRLYCELRNYRAFITLNDLSRRRGSTDRGVALASAFGHERGWNVRWHEEEKVLGTTGFDYSGPRRSHEGARATGRQHVHGLYL